MAPVPFDTLKLACRLEAAGFPAGQPADTAEALAAAMPGAKRAIRPDLAAVRSEIAVLRAELKADIELLRRDLTTRLGAMPVVAVG